MATTTMSKSRILIIGMGGIGTITAYNLEIGGQCEVTAVLRSNYDIVKEKGFTLDSVDHGKVQGWRPTEIRKTIPNIYEEDIRPFEFVVVTTKNTPDFPPSLPELLRPCVHPSSTIVLIQNGLSIHLPFVALFPENPILSGISRMGAYQTSPSKVLEDDPDRLSVGVFTSSTIDERSMASAQRFVSLYAASGKADVTYSASVRKERWRKLIYNASWNPICALTGLDTGRLRLVSPDPADPASPVNLLLKPAMREVLRIAAADGYPLASTAEEEESIVAGVLDAEPVEVYCAPSMLQDARRHGAWEVENLLGEPLKVAREKGIDTPVLAALYALCKSRMWALREEWGVVDKDVEARKRSELLSG